ncbi:MAG: PrpF domain-containing protein, partial [Pseudomonadota bacterium]
MSEQLAIPCLFMRGGTSRGPYFNAADLPSDREKLSQVLLDAMGRCGSPQPDGLGGTASVTNKVAILSIEDGVVQYFFAQVVPDEDRVDYSPNCGNMLVAVGPAAIEMGLVAASEPETVVDIINVNTGVRAQSVVQTPNGKVTYGGDAKIGGVALAAAPILVSFVEPGGAKTSGLLPTGKAVEEIDGCAVSLIDSAVPMLWTRADDLGVTLPNTERLDQDAELMARLEAMRIEAGHRMGLGDCTGRVIPKIGMIAKPSNGGTISARYFTPDAQHPTFAFTGAVCGASLCKVPGTIAA